MSATKRIHSRRPVSVEVAGFYYYKPALERVVRQHRSTSKTPLNMWAQLQAEPSNKYDRHAVKVMVDGKKIGYIPAHLSPQYSPPIQSFKRRGYVLEVSVVIDVRYRKDGTVGGYHSVDMLLPAPSEIKVASPKKRPTPKPTPKAKPKVQPQLSNASDTMVSVRLGNKRVRLKEKKLAEPPLGGLGRGLIIAVVLFISVAVGQAFPPVFLAAVIWAIWWGVRSSRIDRIRHIYKRGTAPLDIQKL